MMKLRFSIAFILSWFAFNSTFSQQIVKGKVSDSQDKSALVGVVVVLQKDTSVVAAVSTNENGYYEFTNITAGRYDLKFKYIGYSTLVVDNVIVTSAKQNILNADMIASASDLGEIEIVVYNKSGTVNDMALVSARMFNAEETGRYAGSRLDPARMASNYAGVQGSNDSRNDIVIRGNSPLGLLWRVDGVDIPNPNHFAIAGTTGGPVSVINNKTLGNSDFFTGAFPSEYGNSMSGVFDIRLRNGNTDKHEFSGQFGFLGTELFAEGPLGKNKKSSYIAAYRYSTISIFNVLGIDIGTNAIPKYQDMTVKLNFPIGEDAYISAFAMAGKSDIDIVISNQKDTSEVDLYGENDRDQYFGTYMGVIGATYGKSFKNKGFFQNSLALSNENQHTFHQFIRRHVDGSGQFVVDTLFDLQRYSYDRSKISNNMSYYLKKDIRNSIKMGLISDYNYFNYQDSIYRENLDYWDNRWDSKESAVLMQGYAMWKHKFSDKFITNVGFHSQYFSLNNSISYFEPRLSARWQIADDKSINFGSGFHSQTQPTYTYFYRVKNHLGQYGLHNKNVDFSRSIHNVLGYDHTFNKNLRMKTEVYYQHLYNIPVEMNPSAFSSVNQGSSFVRYFTDTLVNEGIGKNYGLELTLERFFAKKYYFMLTGSLYESLYRGSDNIWRNSDFNGNFAFNALFGYELKAGKNSVLGLGTKVTWAGGRRYGLVDTLASTLNNEVIFLDEQYNEFKFRNYFRTDLKINYIINRSKVTHEIAIDIVNLFDTKNLLSITWAPVPGSSRSPIRENYQLGRLPIFYYKIDF